MKYSLCLLLIMVLVCAGCINQIIILDIPQPPPEPVSIEFEPRSFWLTGTNTLTPTQKFNIHAEEIVSTDILLKFTILQDTANQPALFSVRISNANVDVTIDDPEPIGLLNPPEPQLIEREYDISHIIQETGLYRFSANLKLESFIPEDGWLLYSVSISGIGGTYFKIR